MQPSSGDEFHLASLDSLGGFEASTEELRQQALAKLPLSGERPTIRSHYEGADSSGTVVVTVKPDGTVTDVDVKQDWKTSLSAGDFAEAVLRAYGAAVASSLEDMAMVELWQDEQRRVAERERERAERYAAQGGQSPPPPAEEAPQPDTPPEDPRDWMNWIQDSLYRIDDQMYQIERVERGLASERDTAVWGPHGYLKLIHRGREIVSIEGDPTRIRTAEAYQLRSEALDVLRQAH